MKILVVSDESHECIFYMYARTHLHKNTIVKASLNVSLAEPVHTKQSFMLTFLKSPPVLRAIEHHFIPSTKGLEADSKLCASHSQWGFRITALKSLNYECGTVFQLLTLQLGLQALQSVIIMMTMRKSISQHLYSNIFFQTFASIYRLNLGVSV